MAYLIDILNLPENMSVCSQHGVSNGILSDMATEKTIIKDMTGRGSIVRLTAQKSALHSCKVRL